MQPTDLQKNAQNISDLKDIHDQVDGLIIRIKSRYNADATNRATDLLRYAKSELLERMVELGVKLKIEDGKSE